MTSKDYQFYTVRDFALDENFQQWILHPDMKSRYFWEKWVLENPGKETTIKEAAKLVRSVRFQSYSLSGSEKDHLWDAIWDKIVLDEADIEETAPSKLRIVKHKAWRYAAAVTIGVIMMFGIWRITDHQSGATISFSAKTQLGEIKKVFLPDSSAVILNADSKLVYTEEKGSGRKVWLEGEAYFHVRHTLDNEAFIVHTYDNVSVAVLGTRFNVNSFGKQIAIVLQQGSVKLNIKRDTGVGMTQLYLKPGEMVRYDKEDGDYTKSKVDVAQFVGWTSGRLVMNDYSLKDAVIFMQQVFGKKLIISDANLLDSKISGSMPIVYNVDTMLMQFGKAFHVNFQEKEDGIWLRK